MKIDPQKIRQEYDIFPRMYKQNTLISIQLYYVAIIHTFRENKITVVEHNITPPEYVRIYLCVPL